MNTEPAEIHKADYIVKLICDASKRYEIPSVVWTALTVDGGLATANVGTDGSEGALLSYSKDRITQVIDKLGETGVQFYLMKLEAKPEAIFGFFVTLSHTIQCDHINLLKEDRVVCLKLP